jgi:transposase
MGAGPSSRPDAQKKSQRAAEQDRVDIAQARQHWRAQQAEWRAQSLVFVDETGASTKMTRLYGRCLRGERLVAPVPWGHWKTTTFIGALRQDGLVAPCAFDGPMNGEKFRAWVEQFLVPELKPGDIVILDNLSSHKVEGVRTAIESAKARLLYLPAYSPDLNPIEQWFAKLKALLRKAAARSFDALIHAIARALEAFTPDECANYLENSGYPRQS